MTDSHQLEQALRIFALDSNKDEIWAKRNAVNLTQGGIDSIARLAQACRDGTLNSKIEHKFAIQTIDDLKKFLPGPVQEHCLLLATQAVEEVEKVQKATKKLKGLTKKEQQMKIKKITWYQYGPRPGKPNRQVFKVEEKPGLDGWRIEQLHVDCSGFVRNVIKAVIGMDDKEELELVRTDRDYMRAKDFYDFFSQLDKIPVENRLWGKIDDMSKVLPGDVLVYRCAGKAAGGAAFIDSKGKKDSLERALYQVKTAQLYHKENKVNGGNSVVDLTDEDRDKAVEWRDQVLWKLKLINVDSTETLDKHLPNLNTLLEEKGKPGLTRDTRNLLQKAVRASELNTGHIMFAAGPAELRPGCKHTYDIPIFHSTGFGKNGHKGVERSNRTVTFKNKKWVKRGGSADDTEQDADVLAARIVFDGNRQEFLEAYRKLVIELRETHL